MYRFTGRWLTKIDLKHTNRLERNKFAVNKTLHNMANVAIESEKTKGPRTDGDQTEAGRGRHRSGFGRTLLQQSMSA